MHTYIRIYKISVRVRQWRREDGKRILPACERAQKFLPEDNIKTYRQQRQMRACKDNAQKCGGERGNGYHELKPS